jgi:hypothetical protein
MDFDVENGFIRKSSLNSVGVTQSRWYSMIMERKRVLSPKAFYRF